MMAAILKSAILNSAILHKKYFTHSFWLNLMMAAILNSAILDSAILHKKTSLIFLTQFDDSSHLEFCQLEFHHLGFNHFSFSSQTHSHLPRLVPNICTKKLHSFILTQLDDCSYLEICHPQFSHLCTKNTSLIHSDSTWWWQPSRTLPCWIQTLPSWTQTPCYLLSYSFKNTLFPLWLWLKLIQSDSNSFILT